MIFHIVLEALVLFTIVCLIVAIVIFILALFFVVLLIKYPLLSKYFTKPIQHSFHDFETKYNNANNISDKGRVTYIIKYLANNFHQRYFVKNWISDKNKINHQDRCCYKEGSKGIINKLSNNKLPKVTTKFINIGVHSPDSSTEEKQNQPKENLTNFDIYWITDGIT